MLVAMVCERYGWDYHTYYNQPVHFLYLIHQKMNIDAKKEEEAYQKMKRTP